MGLHAMIIRLSPLIHKGEQRYKPYIVGDPQMVSLSVTPPLKNPGYAPEPCPNPHPRSVTRFDTYMCWLILAGSSNSGWVDSFLKIIGLEDLVDTEYSKLGKLVCIHDRNVVPCAILAIYYIYQDILSFNSHLPGSSNSF